jgi:hemerythrin
MPGILLMTETTLNINIRGKRMIQWDEKFITGVDEVDTQHKKLIEIASRAHSLLTDKFITDKYDDIIVIIEELADYAQYHFSCEEKLMKERGYKKLFSHVMEHQQFMEKVASTDLRKVDEDQNAYLLGIVNFIVDWTINHILENDKLVFSLA